MLAHRALEALRAMPTDRSDFPAQAGALGVSDRHLRRLVRTYSGHGLKEFHRVRRLQHAASVATRKRVPNWACLAVEVGFADQAHLIREFRALAGVTPVALREERRALDRLTPRRT